MAHHDTANEMASADYREEAERVRAMSRSAKNGVVSARLMGIAMGYDGVAAFAEGIERIRDKK